MSELRHPCPELAVADVAVPARTRRRDPATRVPSRSVSQNSRHGQREVLHGALHVHPQSCWRHDRVSGSGIGEEALKSEYPLTSRAMGHPGYPPPRLPKPPIASTDLWVSIGALIATGAFGVGAVTIGVCAL